MTGPAARGALDGAALLLDVSGPVPARARTVARLLRYAVEQALDDYWDAIRPGEVPQSVGRGRRLRLLAATLGRRFAHDTYTTWCRLSDAARPHANELAPSLPELRVLQAAATAAVDGLAAAAVRTGPATDAFCTSRT
jgi:hypothetical protein